MLKIKKSTKCAYPPVGKYIRPSEVTFKFKDVEIHNNFVLKRLRPKGSRQSAAEASILSKMKAIANGFASSNGDILGR